ncbi:ATP-binding protein [Bacillus sp. CGMCC 1.16541]|uniref:sensor histidine kinase n=1 Tax=Bacillus sp. CGMCC 1.16541 TaxID=2185143 RepID=UPI000D733C57|nr:ATP-binding protein [Bacillus sp. CGMCC 1.16541]
MKLNHKIQLFTTVWLLVILLIVNMSIYVLFYKVTTNGELERITNQTESIASGLKNENINPRDLILASLSPNEMVRVIDQELKAEMGFTNEKRYPKLIKPVYKTKQEAVIRKVEGDLYASVYLPIIWSNGEVLTLEVTEQIKTAQSNLAMLRLVLIVASLVVLIPAFFAGRMLSNLILKPIQSMISTMEEIQRKGMFRKIELHEQSNDELFKMANTFNKMMDLLQRNFDKQQQFVSDASHELKTPLTVIESYAQLLKRWGTKRPDVLEESVEAIHSEAIRMKEMTQQMLALANNDAEWNVARERVDVYKLCIETGKQLQEAYGRYIRTTSTEKQIMVIGDHQKLKQVLVILLDNAMKYSEQEIDVTASVENDTAIISVIDRGVGIPAEDVDKIFDRFFRVDKARSRQTGGTGLGLSIAKRIVDAHDGQIIVESEEGKGTTVIMKLPMKGEN